jgi:glycosyltransferase involved in cell wall biosynthesis
MRVLLAAPQAGVTVRDGAPEPRENSRRPCGGYRHSSIKLVRARAVFAVCGMTREQKLNLAAGPLTPGASHTESPRTEPQADFANQPAEAADLDAELTRTRDYAAGLTRELQTTRRELQSMLASTSWRVTRPLRALATASPKLAKFGRRLANSLWLRKPFRTAGRAAPRQVSDRIYGGLPDRDQLERLIKAAERRATDGRFLAPSGLLDEASYRAAAKLDPTVNAAEHYLTIGWRQGLEPGPRFEGAFLQPYFASAGFSGPAAITYLTLRDAGWPVYATRAEAEATAGLIRTSDLFDAAHYRARAANIGELDPALHYVIVGERMRLTPSEGFDPTYYGERYLENPPNVTNRLHHFLTSGRLREWRPLPVAGTMECDRSRLDPNLQTVLLVVHQATRTGAPILAYNIAMRLRRKCNVIAVLLEGGDLEEDFAANCAAVVGPLSQANWHPSEMKALVSRVLAAYPVSYAIVNSISSWMIVPPLGRALVPSVLLLHEFASYTRPKSAMYQGLEWATEIVFSAELVARSARDEHSELMQRPVHILPQGQCDLPPARQKTDRPGLPPDLARIFRPPGAEDTLVVMGCGSVHIRKGVDLFLSCAAAVTAMPSKRPVRFIWIGNGYDPENDGGYSCYLADQIARSGIGDKVAIIDEIADLAPAYAMTDVFFLSSRLDPLPNVTIDAALHGLPVICFEGSTGMADLLAADAVTRQCVVPHLDVHAAAGAIVDLANDEAKRRRLGDASQNLGRATFHMDDYVRRLAEVGSKAVGIMRQREQDLATLRDDATFDAAMYLPYDAAPATRAEAIVDFLTRWTAVGITPASKNYFFRRPCAGFHPQIYAHAHVDVYDIRAVNPLAHFIRSGRPHGPWLHDVIAPAAQSRPPRVPQARPTALHAHFHYPELVEDFVRRMAANNSPCDLLLSTDETSKASLLRKATAQYRRGEVHVRVLPNRGRDIGAFLTGFREDIGSRYEIVGHVHAKRSLFALGSSDPHLGERWRRFLWDNLLGEEHAMMDMIIDRLSADDRLGLVFPDSPQLPCWDGNREIAEQLARRIGMTADLPPFFDFPAGTMFWARTAALKPLFDLQLEWEDYPSEPMPSDGTILHALERLLPFVAQHAGYRFAATHVPGVTW